MTSTDAELVALFAAETREHLEQFEPDVLALEQGAGNAELVNRIFRAIHSIKGSAGFFGFKPMNDLSHVMEDVIARVRDGAVRVTQDLADALLAGKDKLIAMLRDLERCGAIDFSDEKATLQQWLAADAPRNGNGADGPRARGPSTGGTATPAAVAATGSPLNARLSDLKPHSVPLRFNVTPADLIAATRSGHRLYLVTLGLRQDLERRGKTLAGFVKTVKSLGRIVDAYVEPSSVTSLAACLDEDPRFLFLFSTVLEADLVALGLEVPPDKLRAIAPEEFPVLAQGSAAPHRTPPEESERRGVTPSPKEGMSVPIAVVRAPGPSGKADDTRVGHATDGSRERGPSTGGAEGRPAPAAAGGSPSGGETIRVSVALLDDLMNLAGEMVLGRNQLLRMAGDVARDVTGLPGLLQNINLVTSELQEKVMHTRMQRLETVFSKFPRIIRDMGRKLGKDMDLKISGEDVELDKSIVETLSDPLTHLVRNCADHAIETPDAREAAGKPRIGVVRLSARHEGGQVHIEIADDGRGMDPERIRAKAIEKNFLKPDEAARLSAREALSLIFLPGFSTAETITDVSGRGVGMDVVKTNIEQLGGSVEIESEPGQGTCVRLRLPLTLAIIPSMIVTARGRRFAVPQVSLEELVRLDEQLPVEQVRGADVIRLRGHLLPLVHLDRLLGIAAETDGPRASGPSTGRTAGGLEDEPSVSRSAERDPATGAQTARGHAGPPPEHPSGEPATPAEPGPPPTEGPSRSGATSPDSGSGTAPAVPSQTGSRYVVVLKTGPHRYGLVVDTLLDVEEIVVKPLSSFLKKCKCYSGATIMGDGKVAMILDAAGMAEHARLRFGELAHETARRAESARVQEGEPQLLALFRNAAHELFAVNLAMVNRIEKVRTADLLRIGQREYLKYRNESLRVIRLHDFMPVTRPAEEADTVYIIVPKLVKHPMGIVATQIDDVLETAVMLDRHSVTGTGILGSAVIQDRLTVFLDLYELFEAADPDTYGWKKATETLNGKRILLAEDTAFFRTVETEYLDEFGCQVDAVTDGLQAWERLNRQTYDILLTDIEMPRMNGFELCQRVRASDRLKHLPVVALTALTPERFAEQGRQAGVSAYETKLDKERLRDTLEKILGA